MRRPRHAFLAAGFLLGALWLMAPDVPVIQPSQAAQFAGQDVIVQGTVADVTAWSEGGRFLLVRDGHALEARVEGALPPLAAWIEARGDLRRDGSVTLWVQGWRVAAAREAQDVPISVVAQDPGVWHERRLTLRGEMDADWLKDQGRSLPLGDGPRIPGRVEATGVLVYDARCFCHQFHVDHVRPWTR